jgi:hypothetical protein
VGRHYPRNGQWLLLREISAGSAAFLVESGLPLYPQGAGATTVTHSCPCKLITVVITICAVSLLSTNIQYEVPEQDLPSGSTRSLLDR